MTRIIRRAAGAVVLMLVAIVSADTAIANADPSELAPETCTTITPTISGGAGNDVCWPGDGANQSVGCESFDVP